VCGGHYSGVTLLLYITTNRWKKARCTLFCAGSRRAGEQAGKRMRTTRPVWFFQGHLWPCFFHFF